MTKVHGLQGHRKRSGSPVPKATMLSRRQLLRGAAGGVAMVTPLGWLAQGSAHGSTSLAARPTPVADFDAGVAIAWFDEILALIQATPGFSPPVASRAIAYAGVALYESLQPGMSDQRSMVGLLSGLPPLPTAGHNAAYDWPVVANAAMAATVRALFPTAPADRKAALDRLEGSFVASAPRGIRQRSIDRGRGVARAVIDWSAGDGGHEAYLRNFPNDYVVPTGPGLWEPTPPGFLRPLQPYWGSNRAFLSAHLHCDPGPPHPFSSDPASAFFLEAAEAHAAVNTLTEEQLAIATFWADDPGRTATPPGHSLSILTQVLHLRDASLADAADAYARLGLAVGDAFIACWRVKYRHNLLRPITFIRAHIDPGWGDPLPLVTPPFPEYTSGHSVQSAAAAAVLTARFGRMAFVDHTQDVRGLPARSFASFEAAAAEAAISRLYGGIHYRAAIDRGLTQGRCIGEAVAALSLRG
jgi:hypothetical protein